jgi:hypothetical protein
MTNLTRRILIILIFAGTAVFTHAQDKDFGIWYSIAAQKEIAKDLDFEADINLRTYHDAGEIEEGFIDAGLGYKINDHLSAGLTYRLTEMMEKDDNFHPRHKWFADFRAKTTIGDLDISGRLRFQQRFKTYFRDENDRESKETFRVRLKGAYDIPKFPVNPFISAELFLPVFDSGTRTVTKQRFTGGIDYNITKKHAIEIEYMFQRDFFPDMLDMNIISVNYSIKL